MDSSRSHDPSVNGTPSDLPVLQRQALESALRVDQVGEVAANWIYRGQLAILGKDPHSGPLIQVCLFHIVM